MGITRRLIRSGHHSIPQSILREAEHFEEERETEGENSTGVEEEFNG